MPTYALYSPYAETVEESIAQAIKTTPLEREQERKNYAELVLNGSKNCERSSRTTVVMSSTVDGCDSHRRSLALTTNSCFSDSAYAKGYQQRVSRAILQDQHNTPHTKYA